MNEMRKLIEAIDEIERDTHPRQNPRYYLGDVRGDLYNITKKAADYRILLSDYSGGNPLSVEIMSEIEEECYRLLKLIDDVL